MFVVAEVFVYDFSCFFAGGGWVVSELDVYVFAVFFLFVWLWGLSCFSLVGLFFALFFLCCFLL